MRKTWLLSTAVIAATALARLVPAAEPTDTPRAAFDRLKKLAGEWTFAAGENAGKEVAVTYRLTGAGSALVETLFPGSPHEMTTVYYLDGEALVLTHYCAAGNQPHMRAELGSDPAKLAFRFAGGSNIRPEVDTHMHEARFTFIDADHIRSEWVMYTGGAEADVKVFDLVRRK